MEKENETLETAGIDDGGGIEGQICEAEEQPIQPRNKSTRKLWDWLDGYQEFTEDFEPPHIFNKWCGLAALAAATGRKVWLEDANVKVYPNLFVVLVASSGVGKTTAMREIRPFIDECKIAISAGKPSASKFLSSMGNATRLTEGLGLITNYLIWAEELPSFLGNDAYKTGMLADLTTLYDCQDHWERETHIRGVEPIEGAYLCMLAGTTAEGLFDVMPKGSVTQGFTARLMFVYAQYNEKRVVEKPWGKKQIELNEPLRHDIREIAKLKGAAKFSDIARVMWADYYVYRKHPIDEYTDVRLQGYASRKPFYVKKLALLQSISESNSLVVEAHHIEKAILLLEELDKNLLRVYGDIAPSVVVQFYGKIIARLQRSGGQRSRVELQRDFAYSLDAQDFTKAIDALYQMGYIDMVAQQATGHRPKHVYRLTESGQKWQKNR